MRYICLMDNPDYFYTMKCLSRGITQLVSGPGSIDVRALEALGEVSMLTEDDFPPYAECDAVRCWRVATITFKDSVDPEQLSIAAAQLCEAKDFLAAYVGSREAEG